jgi:Holliday junction resolvasome RuvABC endonuclease subunit
MDDIKKLIAEEKELKIQLKNIRTGIKEKLEASSIYAACLEQTLDSNEIKVSKKLAKAHALKVARSSFDDDEDEEDS